MAFADISVVPVPSGHRAAYVAFSRRMAEVYREHGATGVVDYWQSDAPERPQDFHADGVGYAPGELRGFAEMVGAAAGESVVVTVTLWPSRAARDRGAAAATADPRVLATIDEEPVFDGWRLVAGSFEVAMSLPGDAGDAPAG